jgi:hypothetical protein
MPPFWTVSCHHANVRTIQVVFKALIVLHTMIRSGSTDNVLSHLASSDVLRLRNVSGASWEGVSLFFLILFTCSNGNRLQYP